MSFKVSMKVNTDLFTVPNTDFMKTFVSMVFGAGAPFTSARRVSESILRRRLRLAVGVKARTPRIQGMGAAKSCKKVESRQDVISRSQAFSKGRVFSKGEGRNHEGDLFEQPSPTEGVKK